MNRNWQEGSWEFQARLYGNFCCSMWSWKWVTAFLVQARRVSSPQHGVRLGLSRGWARVLSQVVCPPPWWLWAQVECAASCLFFFLPPEKRQLNLWSLQSSILQMQHCIQSVPFFLSSTFLSPFVFITNWVKVPWGQRWSFKRFWSELSTEHRV